jgi:hypothetical protein
MNPIYSSANLKKQFKDHLFFIKFISLSNRSSRMQTLSERVFDTDFSKMTKEDISQFWDEVDLGAGWLDWWVGFHGYHKHKIAFLKLLLSDKGLFKAGKGQGGQFPSTIAANRIGVSQVTVCKYLKQLRELKLIELTNEKYAPGEKSREWRVVDPCMRECQYQLEYTSMSDMVKRKSENAFRALSDHKRKQELWSKLSITPCVDPEWGDFQMRMGSEAFRDLIRDIVHVYTGREYNLLHDFAEHMFHHRKIYCQDRKYFMAWFFEDSMTYFRTKKTRLTKAHYIDAAFIRETDDFAFKTKAVEFIVGAVKSSRDDCVVISDEDIQKCKKLDREFDNRFIPEYNEWDTKRLCIIYSLEKSSLNKETRGEYIVSADRILSSLTNLGTAYREALVNFN